MKTIIMTPEKVEALICKEIEFLGTIKAEFFPTIKRSKFALLTGVYLRKELIGGEASWNNLKRPTQIEKRQNQ